MDLLALEAFDVVLHALIHLGNVVSDVYLLLSSLEFLLLDPTIDSPDLDFNAVLESQNSLVLSLELSPHNRVHSRVPISHLLSLILSFLLVKLVFHVHLIADIVKRTKTFLLLLQESVDEVGHLQLQSRLELVLD